MEQFSWEEFFALKRVCSKFPLLESKKEWVNRSIPLHSKEHEELRKIQLKTNRSYPLVREIWLRSATIDEAVNIIFKYL